MLSGVQDRLAPLQSWLFPQRVFLQLEDRALTGMVCDGRQIRWLERVALPLDLCREGVPQAPRALGDFVGDWLVERGFAGARVRAVLPRAATAWRVIEWSDGLWPEQPELMVRQQQEAFSLGWPLDAPGDGVDLRLEPLAGDPPRSLMVAVRRFVLEEWIEVFSQAGVALDALEPWQVCLWRAVGDWPAASGGTSVLLELGAEQCWLVALQNGQPFGEWALPSAQDPQALVSALEEWRRDGAWPASIGRAAALWLVPVEPHANDSAAVAALLRQRMDWEPQLLDPLAMGWWSRAGLPAESPDGPPGLAVLWGLASAELVP